MRSARWLVGLLGPPLAAYAVLTSSCSNIDTTLTPATAINIGVTAVSIDPMTFLGGVACSNVDGGMASYVATITDVTDPEHPFTLPSSPPTACSQLVYFQDVNPGDLYVGAVDGYPQLASQLVPLCGALPPGAIQHCNLDSECKPAYGCQGTCKVTTYKDQSIACLQGCAGDAGDTAITCAAGCGKLTPPADATEATALVAYQNCLTGCGLDITNGCVNATNNYCLTTEFAALQNDCPDEPAGDGPTDGVVRGAVKACTCTYTPTEGSRQMFLVGDSAATVPVTPSWTTSCGQGDPVQSQIYADAPLEPCVPLAGSLNGTTTIAVIPTATLGELSCGGTGGITSFDVVPGDASLMTYKGLACSSSASATYTGVTPETNYTFTVYGYQGGTTPTQSTDCVAFPAFGTVTTALCDVLIPLADAGGFEPDGGDAGDGG